ncbi:MAG TPA: DUF1641 domain-containing protein [Thermoplasmata archaeon]|nr:DUF1641 domain-containing protein [Thermoplasmata archaeon]
MTSSPAASTPSTVAPAPGRSPDAAAAMEALGARLARWQSDGTLDRLFSIAEGAVGVSDAVTDRMLASAGTTFIGAISLLDWVAQDEKRRDAVQYLIERVAEWKETGALDTLVTLAEGLVGIAQATTDQMVGHAGASAIGWIEFIESLPPKGELEPLVHAAVKAGPVLALLSDSSALVGDPAAREKALAEIPNVEGVFALGRALRDTETQRGLRMMLLLLKQLGRTSSAPPPR